MTERSGSVRDRLVLLDALRGLAALVVLWHHARTLFAPLPAQLATAAPLLHAAAAFVSARNTEAVLLFFVLSGFSIRLSVERRDLREPGAVADYLQRRVRRILPLYLLALLLSGLVAHHLAEVPAQALSSATLAGNLLFLQTANGVEGQWVMPYAGNAALWSLSFEMFFYLAYPVLLLGVRAPAWRTLIVLSVSALGFVAGELAPNPIAMFCAASVIWYLGVELAELHLRGRTGLPVQVFAALFVLLLPLGFGPHRVTFHGLLVGLALFLAGAGLLRAAPRLPRIPAALLSPFARVGAFSYALYLFHVPILRAFAATLGPSFASVALACLCSCAAAYAAERALAVRRESVTRDASDAQLA